MSNGLPDKPTERSPRTELNIGAPNAPVLDAFMADRARVSFIMGPLGSGKTYGCIQKLLLLICEQLPNADNVRPSRFAIVRNTYVDLAATTMKDFREVFIEGEMGYWKLGGIDPPTFHCNLRLEDGTFAKAEFVFMALDRPADVRKLRGTQFTGAWFNEIKELPKDILDMMDGRIGRYPSLVAGGVVCTWHGMIGDTNAPDDDHWYHRMAEEETPWNWMFYRQPGGVIDTGECDDSGRVFWAINPHAENIDNLPGKEGYYTNQMSSKDDDWIRINLANQYGFFIEGKPVHPNYIDSLHCMKKEWEVRDWPIYLGLDFGRTPAAAFFQRDELSHRKILFDEFLSEDISASIFAPELKLYMQEKYGTEFGGLALRCWGDPAGGQGDQATEMTAFKVMRSEGFVVSPAQTNNVLARRLSISRPLREICIDGNPRLMISPKAKVTRKGLRGGFCYRRIQVSGSERYTEMPDKNRFSHPVEAAEYGLMGLGEYHEATKTPGRRTGRRKRSKVRAPKRWGIEG